MLRFAQFLEHELQSSLRKLAIVCCGAARIRASEGMYFAISVLWTLERRVYGLSVTEHRTVCSTETSCVSEGVGKQKANPTMNLQV